MKEINEIQTVTELKERGLQALESHGIESTDVGQVPGGNPSEIPNEFDTLFDDGECIVVKDPEGNCACWSTEQQEWLLEGEFEWPQRDSAGWLDPGMAQQFGRE